MKCSQQDFKPWGVEKIFEFGMVLVIYIILGNTFAIIHSLIHCWNVYCINVNRVLFICIRVCLLPVFFSECWNLIIQHFLCQFKYCSKRDFVYNTKSKYITYFKTPRKQRNTNKRYYLPEIRLLKIIFFVKCHIQNTKPIREGDKINKTHFSKKWFNSLSIMRYS